MMSTDLTIHGPGEAVVSHDTRAGEHDGHHHKETFITKYVFSQDHKMICKQFLITGMIWAILGGLMSVLFRLQLG
jgi:cytochrome c oxidase subunit I